MIGSNMEVRCSTELPALYYVTTVSCFILEVTNYEPLVYLMLLVC